MDLAIYLTSIPIIRIIDLAYSLKKKKKRKKKKNLEKKNLGKKRGMHIKSLVPYLLTNLGH